MSSVLSQDGRPLEAAEGPLALRALSDVRPGPRHVRNLCALLNWNDAPGRSKIVAVGYHS